MDNINKNTNQRTYVCTNCGKREQWSESWSHWSAFLGTDPVLFACSNECQSSEKIWELIGKQSRQKHARAWSG